MPGECGCDLPTKCTKLVGNFCKNWPINFPGDSQIGSITYCNKAKIYSYFKIKFWRSLRQISHLRLCISAATAPPCIRNCVHYALASTVHTRALHCTLIDKSHFTTHTHCTHIRTVHTRHPPNHSENHVKITIKFHSFRDITYTIWYAECISIYIHNIKLYNV